MKKVAIVLCCEKDEQAVGRKGLFSSWFAGIQEFFRSLSTEKFFAAALKRTQINEDMEISTITLPYTLERLAKIRGRRIRQINEYLQGICLQEGIDHCILPDSIYELHTFEKCIRSPYKGEFLYRCLLGNILEEIFTKRGGKVWELDIVIIQGLNRKDLYSIIDLLSPMVRFLTVISSEQDLIEEEAGETFMDSGLAVMITSDWKGISKNAEVIINLDDEKGIISHAKTKKESVTIHMSKVKASTIQCDNILIQGLHIKVQQTMLDSLESNVLRYFTPEELAETIIVTGLELEDQAASEEFPQMDVIKKVSKEFKKGGYSIKGFAGRHNMIQSKDIAMKKM